MRADGEGGLAEELSLRDWQREDPVSGAIAAPSRGEGDGAEDAAADAFRGWEQPGEAGPSGRQQIGALGRPEIGGGRVAERSDRKHWTCQICTFSQVGYWRSIGGRVFCFPVRLGEIFAWVVSSCEDPVS